jgi:hypothetical protein
MKYAGKTFTLYASEPVAIQGSDSLVHVPKYRYRYSYYYKALTMAKTGLTIATVASGASSTQLTCLCFLT